MAGIRKLASEHGRMTFISQAQVAREAARKEKIKAFEEQLRIDRENARIKAAEELKAMNEWLTACDEATKLPKIGTKIISPFPTGIYIAQFPGFPEQPYVVISLPRVNRPLIPMWTLNILSKHGLKCFLDQWTLDTIEQEFENDLDMVAIKHIEVMTQSKSGKSLTVRWVRS